MPDAPPKTLSLGRGAQRRINLASELLTTREINMLAGMHGVTPWVLQSTAGGATLNDSGPALVGELLRLAGLALRIGEQAVTFPDRSVADVVNALTRRS